MKVAFLYPPYRKGNRYPHFSQNRQTRFSKSRYVKIFPLIPASLVTMLAQGGHDVLFLDAINRRLSRTQYESELSQFQPEIIFLDSKTPLMHMLWREISFLKGILPGAKVVVVGDHASALPKETLANSPCDYVILGGDYDAVGAALVDAIEGNNSPPSGVLHRSNASAEASPCFVDDLDELPLIDRELTRWRDYGEAYLRMPAMYVLSGRGCGRRGAAHGGCTFCSWQHNLWDGTARLRSPENFVGELVHLSRKYPVKEFFDDNESGGFWDVEWTKELCGRLQKAGLAGRVSISSNARADALSADVCGGLAKSGFRLLKVGLESGSNSTLLRLNKGETVQEIIAGIKRAKDFGLRVLITTMVGYPWESEEDARATFEVVRELLTYKARLGDSLQCSVVVPYPGTPLHEEAYQEGWSRVARDDL